MRHQSAAGAVLVAGARSCTNAGAVPGESSGDHPLGQLPEAVPPSCLICDLYLFSSLSQRLQ